MIINNNIIVLMVMILLLVGCSSNHEEETIENQFNNIKELISERNGKELKNVIDKSSIEYFENLSKLLVTKSEFGLNNLGGSHDALLNTRLIYEVFVQSDPLENKFANVEMLLNYTSYIGVGLLNLKGIERFSFREVEEISNNNAIAIIKYQPNLNDISGILLRYEFKKEEGIWKLDIPSTFKLDEKRLRGPFERGKFKNVGDFIAQYIKGNVNKAQVLRTKR